jgi:inner membrane transporter RhtA
VAGAVFLRVLFAAVVLLLVWRPRVGDHARRDFALAAAFGLSLAGMNFAFYGALDRIPLGIAVTIEFVGPLGVAVVASRRVLDLVWVALAAAGILLLSDFGSGQLDGTGIALALLAGGFWAAYILLAMSVGRAFPGGGGLALALVAASVLLAPVGAAEGGGDLLVPWIIAVGAAVAMLSSAIPYSLELEALRRLPPGVFGVLMSLEPALAALAGYVALGQGLTSREAAAIGLVVAACAGAARGAEIAPRDV